MNRRTLSKVGMAGLSGRLDRRRLVRRCRDGPRQGARRGVGTGTADTRRHGRRRDRRRAGAAARDRQRALQAYNMVTIKSRVDGQIIQARQLHQGQDVKAGHAADPDRPSAIPGGAGAGGSDQTERRGPARQRAGHLVRSGPSWWRRATNRARPTTRPRRRPKQLKASIKADEAADQPGSAPQPRLCRRSAPHRRQALRQRLVDVGNMARATPKAPRSSRWRSLKPILVTFTLPQEHQHKLPRKAGKGAARGPWPGARTTRPRSPTANSTLSTT